MATPSKQKSSLIRKKEFYAYYAGLFDGEGTVYIYRQDWNKYKDKEWFRNRKSNSSPSYRLSVKITNTNKDCLEFIQKRLGGTIYAYKDRRSSLGKTQYTWNIYANNALRLLSKMLPYLIIKEEQAKVAIKFQMRKQSEDIGGNIKLTEEQLQWREKQRLLIKELNRAAATTNHQDSENGEVIV